MGIREELAEEQANFVSLRQLIEQLSAAENVTLQDAADWLSRKLGMADDSERPAWCEFWRGKGIQTVSGNDVAKAWRTLQAVISKGAFEQPTAFEDLDDDIPF
jgi:hypothetical protein